MTRRRLRPGALAPVLVFLLILVTLCSTAVAASPDWQAARPARPETATIRGVTYGNGLYVAVTDDAAIMLSGDGQEWAVHELADRSLKLNGITYGMGRFVAVGEGGALLLSPNGITWTQAKSLTSRSLNAVTYCGDRFVAVGDEGQVRTSVDGLTWTYQAGGTNRPLRAVACGGGRYVAVGDEGTIIQSADRGDSWQTVQGQDGSNVRLHAVAHGPAGFVAAGLDGMRGVLLHSAAGDQWQSGTLHSRFALTAIAATPTRYRAVGTDGAGIATAFTSTDGINWTVEESPALKGMKQADGARLVALAYGAPGYVAVGTKAAVVTLPEASWSPFAGAGSGFRLRAVVRTEAYWVALSDGGDLLTSIGLDQWTRVPDVPFKVNDLLWFDRRLVAVGEKGLVLVSEDHGATWQRRNAGVSADLYFLVASPSHLVAAGAAGTVVVSPTGRDWSSYSLPQRTDVTSLQYANQYLITTEDGTLYTSTDGRKWEEHRSPAAASPQGWIHSDQAEQVARIAIQNASQPGVHELEAGRTHEFIAVAYDKNNKVLGALEPVWTLVYPNVAPPNADASIATVDQHGTLTAWRAGTSMVLRANFGELTAHYEFRVLPSLRPLALTPPARPTRSDGFVAAVEGITSRDATITIGVPYQVKLRPSAAAGSGTASEEFKPIWFLSYRSTYIETPRASLDANGRLTVYDPGELLVCGYYYSSKDGSCLTVKAVNP